MNWNIFKWFRERNNYVIADPNDNCITISKSLCKKMRLLDYEGDNINVLTFKVPGEDVYAFTINPDLEEDVTCLSMMMYDTKSHTIGFESRCPTVNRIFYDYGLPIEKPIKLTISVHKADVNGMVYYVIEKPHEKCIGTDSEA